MRELVAVNMLLRAVGSSPVNSLATAHPDAVNARASLSRVRSRVQKQGWWFNIDYNITFEPDPITKEIAVPDEITKVVFNEREFVIRGRRLYNKVDNTYQFSATVTAVKAVRILEWDDMADSCQEYCAFLACSEFVRDELEDAGKEASLRQSAGEAKLYLDKDNLEQGQYNVFQSQRILRARSGIRPYMRQTTRGKNFG